MRCYSQIPFELPMSASLQYIQKKDSKKEVTLENELRKKRKMLTSAPSSPSTPSTPLTTKDPLFSPPTENPTIKEAVRQLELTKQKLKITPKDLEPPISPKRSQKKPETPKKDNLTEDLRKSPRVLNVVCDDTKFNKQQAAMLEHLDHSKEIIKSPRSFRKPPEHDRRKVFSKLIQMDRENRDRITQHVLKRASKIMEEIHEIVKKRVSTPSPEKKLKLSVPRLEGTFQNRMKRSSSDVSSPGVLKTQYSENLETIRSDEGVVKENTKEYYAFQLKLEHKDNIQRLFFHIFITDVDDEDKAFELRNAKINSENYIIFYPPSTTIFYPTEKLSWIHTPRDLLHRR